MIYTIILCTIFGVFILMSFCLGFYLSNEKSQNKTISLAKINPVATTLKKAKSNKVEEKSLKKEQEIFDINLANIDAYNCTEIGQKDFPN